MSFDRMSGILLHITSLPGSEGLGTLGEEALQFIDFLEASGQKIWQICPIGPTGYGDSPYQTFSAFAGNSLFISLLELVKDGLLKEEDLPDFTVCDLTIIDYGKVINTRKPVLKKAFSNFKVNSTDYQSFLSTEAYWLEDFTAFMAIKDYFGGGAWSGWEHTAKIKNPERIAELKEKLRAEIEYEKFIQFIVFRQWKKVHEYASGKGISIFGDIPIFVAFDSADAWANPQMFLFDEENNPVKVAGVPPDYFSATGQLWGNPLYNWDYLKSTGYDWWIKRFKKTFEWFDIVRIDHFRGFEAYWAVPFSETTAMNGRWEKGPEYDFFDRINSVYPNLPIVAEDLGVITPEVEALRDKYNFPGMKILQFAFDSGESNPYLPHNIGRNSVVYTGTHDNDTTEGWYAKTSEQLRQFAYKHISSAENKISWNMIRTAWESNANIAIAPMQDFLSLGSNARMNTPGNAGGNWQWRVMSAQLKTDLAERIRQLTCDSGR